MLQRARHDGMYAHERKEYIEDVDDDDDDDEEETIELRVSASRQDNRTMSSSSSSAAIGSLNRLRRMSSSSGTYSQNNQRQHIAVNVREDDVRPANHSTAAAPLLEKFTTLVASGAGVLSATSQKVVNLDLMADSMAEAMSLLQHPFGGAAVSMGMTPGTRSKNHKDLEVYTVEPRLQEEREKHTRLKLQAFWQLLLTGFEVLKFAIGKRAKSRVLWIGLDGKLYLDATKKKPKHRSTKCIFLADIYKVQKGSAAQSFTKSQSWRDARAKDHLSFSIHGKHGKEEQTFAVQVLQTSVRNVLVENLDALLKLMKSDVDGEFPYVAQKVIAQQYALTGEVLTLRQVEDMLLREEDEHKLMGREGSGTTREFHRMGSYRDSDASSNDGSESSENNDDPRDIVG